MIPTVACVHNGVLARIGPEGQMEVHVYTSHRFAIVSLPLSNALTLLPQRRASPRGTSSLPGDTASCLPNNLSANCSTSNQLLPHPVQLRLRQRTNPE
jgi:hypothetical protein